VHVADGVGLVDEGPGAPEGLVLARGRVGRRRPSSVAMPPSRITQRCSWSSSSSRPRPVPAVAVASRPTHA
jgi:hypothetical protein